MKQGDFVRYKHSPDKSPSGKVQGTNGSQVVFRSIWDWPRSIIHADKSLLEVCQLSWQCTGHHPTVWVLGEYNGGSIKGVIAFTQRKRDGSWSWWTNNGDGVFGNEPSREEAIKAANKYFEDV